MSNPSFVFLPKKLNEQAAAMFESGEEPEVTTGLGIMNELVVPCIPLLLAHDAERDLLAVEDMRNRWCSYLGQEMECKSPRVDLHSTLYFIHRSSQLMLQYVDLLHIQILYLIINHLWIEETNCCRFHCWNFGPKPSWCTVYQGKRRGLNCLPSFYIVWSAPPQRPLCSDP